MCSQINAEKSPYLTDKLKIWMLPTLALVKNEKVDDYIVGFTVGMVLHFLRSLCFSAHSIVTDGLVRLRTPCLFQTLA